MLIGYKYPSVFIKIDVTKVCDDHYDSKCMHGKCENCSYTAATFNQERYDSVQQIKQKRGK